MPDEPPILVAGQLFLGRVEEQHQLRRQLHELLAPAGGEKLPCVLLVSGDGGIGKTTLARRFRDIATLEQPFEGGFQILWIDWEDERRRSPALTDSHCISPDAVFRLVFQAARARGWEGRFKRYTRLIKIRNEVVQRAVDALSAGDERDELAPLRGAGAEALAKVAHACNPEMGDAGEAVVKAFAEAGIELATERARQVGSALWQRLRSRLAADEVQLFANPNRELAAALGEGLARVAKADPLLVFLDTYEIIDHADIWVREVMLAAGPRLAWILCGRNNLVRGRRFGDGYVKGYADQMPRRLLHWDLAQLAIRDIEVYFGHQVPQRPLQGDQAEVISRLTRGVPLAIREAAEIWRSGAGLDEIAGDITESTPRSQIVNRMTDRYLVHVVHERDRHSIFALALARGDLEIVRAMLASTQANGDLDTVLRRLERDYASVHAELARLYDEPAAFISDYLRVEIRRSDCHIIALNRQAVAVLRRRLARLEAELPLIEERCEDDDYVKAAVDLAWYLWWVDETEAWAWLIPRFVESLAYSRDLRRGLLGTAGEWEKRLSARGKKRLKALRAGDAPVPSAEGPAEMLRELSRLADRGLLAGDGERERRGILDLLRAKLCYSRKEYERAAALYESAEADLPEHGESLQQQLAEAMDDLARRLLWPEGAQDAVSSADAQRFLEKVVAWTPDRAGPWYRLGAACRKALQLEEASKSLQRAIELDPKYAYPHHGLGNVYSDQGRWDAAVVSYQRAIELDPKNASPHYGLGNVYSDQGRWDAAVASYQRALELDPKDAYPHHGLGNVYRDQGRWDAAVASYQRAIELKPSAVFWAALAGLLQKLGRIQEAATLIEMARSGIEQEIEYNRACFEAICGNADRALALLKVALDKGQVSSAWAQRDPDLESIREDPRFRDLVGSAAP